MAKTDTATTTRQAAQLEQALRTVIRGNPEVVRLARGALLAR